jgi:hypothetical protein
VIAKIDDKSDKTPPRQRNAIAVDRSQQGANAISTRDGDQSLATDNIL